MSTAIPAAALEQHIAVLGKNGSGKTFATKAVIVEPLLAFGKRVAIVDPTSAWWGLRTTADGRGAGFKVLVLGGDHGDLPLPVHGGAAVARLIVEQGVNLVADTGNLTVGERTRWMIDFAGTLYRLNRTPLHLVIDEAHVFAPQGKVPDPDTGKMLHAVNQIAAGGRSRGIRLTMLTQRPQKLHKDTLTTADTLIAMRVLAPQDREAVKAWIDGCGNPAQGREVLDSLAQLQRGEGWVWYPEGGVLHRVRFPAIKTFDSSATPKDGDVVAAPRGAAEIDLAEIKAALADAAKEAEANDPNLLKARIAELERAKRAWSREELDAAYARGKIDGADETTLRLARVMNIVQGLRLALPVHIEHVIEAEAIIEGLAANRPTGAAIADEPLDRIREIGAGIVGYLNSQGRAAPAKAPPVKHPGQLNGSRSGGKADGAVSAGGLRRMMIALAQRPAGLTQPQIAIRSGLSRNGGTFRTYMSKMRQSGWIEESSGKATITPSGMSALGAYDPLPTGEALLAYWVSELGDSGASRILQALADVHPRTLSQQELSERTGMSRDGGSFRTYLSRLRTLELISRGAEIRASAELFD